jgi:hypothetical protein
MVVGVRGLRVLEASRLTLASVIGVGGACSGRWTSVGGRTVLLRLRGF